MTRATLAKTALAAAVLIACPFAGWGFLWAYVTWPPSRFFAALTAGGIAVVLLAVAGMYLWGPGDPFGEPPALGDDPDEHVQPLRQAHPAEATLDTDLRQRRMLLRPRGLSERKAAALAAKTYRRALRLRGTRALAGHSGAPAPVPVPGPQPGPTVGAAGAGGMTAKAGTKPARPGAARARGRHRRTATRALAAYDEVTGPQAIPAAFTGAHEDGPAEPLPGLPGDQDCPGELYPDDTQWRTFAAIGKGGPQ